MPPAKLLTLKLMIIKHSKLLLLFCFQRSMCKEWHSWSIVTSSPYNIKRITPVCMNKEGVYVHVYAGTQLWGCAHVDTWRPEVNLGCCSCLPRSFTRTWGSLRRLRWLESQLWGPPVSTSPVMATVETFTDYNMTAGL